MVRLNLICMYSLIIMGIKAQNASPYIITYLETSPVYKGDLVSFIQNHIHYPDQALKDSLTGKVIVGFWIDTLGITTDHYIAKGIRCDMDKEALRVAKLIKYDKPAMQKGKPIKVKMLVPVDFILKKDSLSNKIGNSFRINSFVRGNSLISDINFSLRPGTLIIDNIEDSLYCVNYYSKDTKDMIFFALEKNITGKNTSLDSIYLKTWKCLEPYLCKLENNYLGAITIMIDSLGKVRGAILT